MWVEKGIDATVSLAATGLTTGRRLVHPNIRLFTPPFARFRRDDGQTTSRHRRCRARAAELDGQRRA
jgi:hypothetical protein